MVVLMQNKSKTALVPAVDRQWK